MPKKRRKDHVSPEQMIALADLHDDPNNAKVHGDKSIEALKGSLRQFGQVEPLVVQAKTMRIIGGHGRAQAMRDMDWKEAKVILVDLDDLHATALGLSMNQTPNVGTKWDRSRVQEQLEMLNNDGFDIEGIGFDMSDIEAFGVPEPYYAPQDGSDGDNDAAQVSSATSANDEADKEADAERQELLDEKCPEPPAEPVSKVGDVWALRDHRLICGNCLDALLTMTPDSATLIATDLPYGTTQNSWDKQIIPFKDLWPKIDAVAKKDAAYVFTACQPFTTDVVNSNRNRFRYDIVWRKSTPIGFLNANRQPLRGHETILVFGKTSVYNPQMTEGKPYNFNRAANTTSNYGNHGATQGRNEGTRFPVSVLDFPNKVKAEGESHPTQKPVALLEWIVKTYSNPGDIVVDPTAGSGTALIACETTGRTCHAVELSPAYCDVIIERWETLTGQKAELISSNAGDAPSAL